MINWYQNPSPKPCLKSAELATARQTVLTKPQGSLGRLEEIAIKFASWQSKEIPILENIMVRVFASDHGICAQNVSAFPQQVTMQMVLNFLFGGAAVSVLCKNENANFVVINSGLATALPDSNEIKNHPDLVNSPIASGTKDFSLGKAMTYEEMQRALALGKQVIDTQIERKPLTQLFIGGEMGIGNSSSASAIYCAILGISAETACGPGTGLNAQGITHKASIIKHSLNLHGLSNTTSHPDPLNILSCVGGFEIAALVGAYIAASQQKIPSLIDGFISTAAALVAVEINPSCKDWFLYSHQSAEPAHSLALEKLDARPLLNLGMRLGEGSGAALCISLLKSALSLHQHMATFSEAEVAGKLR